MNEIYFTIKTPSRFNGLNGHPKEGTSGPGDPKSKKRPEVLLSRSYVHY